MFSENGEEEIPKNNEENISKSRESDPTTPRKKLPHAKPNYSFTGVMSTRTPAQSFDNLNPATGESLGKVQIADEKDVNDACNRHWKDTPSGRPIRAFNAGVSYTVCKKFYAPVITNWQNGKLWIPANRSRIHQRRHSFGADCFEYYAVLRRPSAANT